MMQEETSKIFAPTTIICIFAQLGRFKLKLEECKTRRDLLLYWFKHGDSKVPKGPHQRCEMPLIGAADASLRGLRSPEGDEQKAFWSSPCHWL